jgi:hypothetical protein
MTGTLDPAQPYFGASFAGQFRRTAIDLIGDDAALVMTMKRLPSALTS